MQLRYPIQIQSMIKAMTDVVLPAVDPDNKLAQEQSRLIIATLALMATQLPLQFDFDRDELARWIALARQLREEAPSITGSDTLGELCEAASDVLSRAQVGPNQLLEAIRDIRSAISAAVSASAQVLDLPVSARVQSIVLANCKEQLLRDRAWLRLQNWEPDPNAVPPIDQIITITDPPVR